MNELHIFVAKNHDKLVRNDRETLVHIANQIDALKKEKNQDKKAAAKEIIEKTLASLWRVAQTKHDYGEGHTSVYNHPENRIVLERAVGIARRLLLEA